MLDLASGPTIAVSSFHLARSALPRRPSFQDLPRADPRLPASPTCASSSPRPTDGRSAKHLDADQKEAAGPHPLDARLAGHAEPANAAEQGLTLAIRLHREARFPPAEHLSGRARFGAGGCEHAALSRPSPAPDRAPREGLRLVDLSLKPLAREPWAWNDLGNLHKTDGDDEAAATAYRRALALDPDFVKRSTISASSAGPRRWQEAKRHYKRTIALRPGFAAAHIISATSMSRGDSRRRGGEPVAGGGTRSRGERAFWFLARAYVMRGDFERRRTSTGAGPNRSRTIRCPSTTCAPASAKARRRASDAYVSTSFDAFADNLRQHLGRLDYRAPELVAAALDAVRGAQGSLGEAADLGCGHRALRAVP